MPIIMIICTALVWFFFGLPMAASFAAGQALILFLGAMALVNKSTIR